jgi:hypothetical protein
MWWMRRVEDKFYFCVVYLVNSNTCSIDRCIGKNHEKKSVKVCHLLIFKFERLLFRLSNAICRNKNPSQTKDQGRSKDKTIIVAALGSMIWPKIKATHHTII